MGTLTVVNSTLRDNKAINAGGGIYNDENLSITGSTITGNIAVLANSAIFNVSCSVRGVLSGVATKGVNLGAPK